MRRFLSLPRRQRCAAINRKRRPKRSALDVGQLPGWISPPLELLEPRRLLAAGDIDTTFGNAGVAVTSFGAAHAYVQDMAIEPDGKIVAVGFAQNQGYAVARYNTDGSLDTSFGNAGTLMINFDGFVWHVAIQSDGKILLVAQTNGGPNDIVIRLTSSGAMDTNFGDDGEATVDVGGGALAIDPSGNIYVGGDTGDAFDVARLTPNGVLDMTFGNAGIASLPVQPNGNSAVADVAVQSDGKIILAGIAGAPGTTSGFAAVRFNSDGTPDTSFGNGGIAQTTVPGSDAADSAIIQSDGKIVVAGESYGTPNQVSYNLAMTRFNSDGSLDTAFGDSGHVVDQLGTQVSTIYDLLAEPNGKIVASGQADGYAALLRFNSDGSLDQTFGNGGVALSLQNTTGADVGEGHALLQQSDGKYVMASDQFTLERFVGEAPPTTSGISDVSVPENSFGAIIPLANDFEGGSVPATQFAYSILSDSNPALFGSTGINSQTGDLTLYAAANESGTTQLTVRATDPDGAYVETSFGVTLTPDPIDTTYGINGVAQAAFGTNAAAYAAVLQPDGKLVVAGGSGMTNGQGPGFEVARFNSDGSLDTTFGNGGVDTIASGGTVHHLALQPDGQILLMGDDGADSQKSLMVRLTQTGALDTAFGNDGQIVLDGFSGNFALTADDRIVTFVFGPMVENQISRFNSDGSPDTTFGNNGTVISQSSIVLGANGMTIDGNGDIVVCGEHSIGTLPQVVVTRFKSDGSVDTGFGDDGETSTTLRGEFDTLNCLAIQSDGKIVSGGLSVNPVTKIGWDLVLMRYNTDGSLDSTFGTGGIVIHPLPDPLDTAINSLFVEPNGKIVAAGRLGENAALFRFNPDGSLDTTFAGGGVAAASGFEHDGYGAVEQANGDYLLVGSQGTPVHFAVERFLGETPPTTSGIGNISVAENSPATVIALPNDFQGGSVPASQLIYSITGDTNPALFASTNIDPQTGNLTLNYAANETGIAQVTQRATDPDGTYVEASFNVTVAADEPFSPGSLDSTFGANGVVATSTQGIFATLDSAHVLSGKILAAGMIQPSATSNGNYTVTRYNPDGTVDTSFGDDGLATAVINGQVWGAAIQADGKILVSGNSNSSQDATLVRFNADGSLDLSFGTGGVVSTSIGNGQQVVVQGDGKIVIDSIDQGGVGVARYNSDGSLDTTFGTDGIVQTAIGVGNRSIPSGLAIQPDGKILVAAWVWDGSKLDFGVVRYDTDGALDTSFGTAGIVMTSLSSGNDEPNDITVQSDGRILVSGYSSGEGALVRYNADGTLDTTFGQDGISLVPDASVLYQSVVQPNGYIVTAGNVGGFAFGVFRFRPDGSLDTSFNKTGYARASGLTGVAEAIAVAPDGDYVVTGTGDLAPTDTTSTFALARFDGSFAPTTSGISDVQVTENAAATVIPLFDDFQGGSVPASQLAYSVTADSNPRLFTSATIDPQTGNLTLAYASNTAGSAELTVTATDPDGGAVGASFGVTVTALPDAPLTAAGATVTATEGITFSGKVATFTDADPAGTTADYTATIDWGDGATTAGNITSTAGGFAVTGSHVYAEQNQSVPVKVIISDAGGAQATATGTATVADAKIHLTAATTVSPAAGNANNLLLATFSDDGGNEPPGNYSATIDWGDGATTAGSIALSNGVFQIVGSHQYARTGSFTIGVSVEDDGGSVDALVEATAVQLTPNQEYVIAVYHDVLDRAPDPNGLAYWAAQLGQGMAVSSVAQAITHSDEYYANFVIVRDYLKLLGRAADQAGVMYWTQKMQNGLTDQQLEAELAASDEFYARAVDNFDPAGDADDTTIADLDHDTDWVDAVYKLLLGRAADANGETYWVNQLSSGVSRGDVALLIANSAENDSQIINSDYQRYLGRPAEAAGLSYWLNQFAAGETNEDVIAGFTGSAEYYKEHTS